MLICQRFSFKEIALKERSRNLSSPGPRSLETRCSRVCRVSPGVLRGAERHIRRGGATGDPAPQADWGVGYMENIGKHSTTGGPSHHPLTLWSSNILQWYGLILVFVGHQKADMKCVNGLYIGC